MKRSLVVLLAMLGFVGGLLANGCQERAPESTPQERVTAPQVPEVKPPAGTEEKMEEAAKSAEEAAKSIEEAATEGTR